MTTKAAALYCRISQDSTDERAGVERQEQDCRELAARKGWPAADVYVDNDISAWNGKHRPEYRRMLADIAAGKIDAVVVWDLDRLTRSPKELEEFFEVCDAAKLKAMATYTGDIDLGTRTGQFMARVLGAHAKKSSDDTAARVRRASDDKAAKGEWKNTGMRPYGYRWDAESKQLLVVEEEAALVREAADRILKNESRRSIVRDWTKRGLRSSNDGPWTITRLNRVLRSPRIAALRVHRGEVVGEGKWEPLLDRETWNRVTRRITREGNRHPGRQRHVLTGTLVCGGRDKNGKRSGCGEKLGAKMRSAEQIRTYACSGVDCVGSRIGAEPLERIVLDTAWTYFEPDPVYVSGDSPELLALEERLAELEETERQLGHDHYRQKVISRPVFMQEMAALRDERDDLQRQRRKLEKSRGVVVLTAVQVASIEGPPETLTGADDETVEFWRQVVRTVFERIEVAPGWKGRRFSPERVTMHLRPEYADVGDIARPVVLAEGEHPLHGKLAEAG